LEVSGGSKDQPVGRALYCSNRLLSLIGEQVIPASFCKRVVPDDAKVNGKFIYYALKAMYDDRRITQWQVQSTGISNFQFEAFLDECEIGLPPLETQRRIASILSAYDDLIENNTRRIAILEEMARRIYEEWFVRFRFPGHEQVKMVESELGEIPEGWRAQTVEQTFQILGGGTPSKAEPTYWEGGTINWYSPTDLTRAGTSFMDCSSNRITELGLSKSSARLFPPMSVMMTSRATIGVVAVNTTEACTNQGFITCLPSGDYPLWLLYHWLKANVDTFIGLGTGATFKEITKGTFKGIRLLVPPQTIVDKFSDSVEPLMSLSLNLQRKNRNLRAARDLLLPKLISGELDVSTLPEPEEAIAA
jgi:type I restriction enzyme S subunit